MIRRAHAGSAGKVSLALVAALVLVLAFAVAVSAKPAAPSGPPNLPHFFYGNVTTDLGTPLPGMLVTAQAVTGSWTGFAETLTDSMSRYGYTPNFYVPAWDPDGLPGNGAKNGDQIAFFVNGQPALLYDVLAGTTSTTYTFVSGESTKLNLIVNLQYKITATADPNGSITPAGQVTVKYGTSKTFTITPDPGYLILDVLVDGVSNPGAVAAGSYTFTNVTKDHTIHATFVRAKYYIAVNAGVGCTITPPGPQVEVLYKQSITFNIAANTGYDLVNVTVDGASQGPILSYTFANVQADHTIAAFCALKPFVITPGWGANGSITPGTPQTVLYGGSVTFTMVPDTGYTVDNVVVNGVSQGPITTYTFTNVTANGTIVATFKLKPFVITPTAGAHGTITPGTPQTVLYGGSATFTIAADPGYSIVDVLVDGVSVGAIASYTFSNVTADHTIAATFIQTFVITPTAGAGGTITPGMPQFVNSGGSATFTIAPNTGYRIVDVLVDGVPQGAITSYTFSNVMANHTIAATFTPLTYTIIPSAGAGGTITPGTTQTVNYDGSATFTIAANTGYRIVDVLVDGVSQGAITSYTFSNVMANHTIAATFTPLTYTIIPSAGAGGTITPGTPQTVNYGGSAIFAIAPNPYYRIVDVTVDGVSQGAIASYTFTNVTADHIIVATFTKIRTFLPLIFR